jgi:hypothetical protein
MEYDEFLADQEAEQENEDYLYEPDAMEIAKQSKLEAEENLKQ